MRRAFYPLAIYDWLGDINLRSCHPLVRGVAMDLICFCFQGEPRGFLRIKTRGAWTALKDQLPPTAPDPDRAEFAQNDLAENFNRAASTSPPDGGVNAPPDGPPNGGAGATALGQYLGTASGLFMLPSSGAIEGLLPVMLGLPAELVQWSIEQLESRSIFIRGRDGILYYPPIVEADAKHRQRVQRAKDAYKRRQPQTIPMPARSSSPAKPPAVVHQDGVPDAIPTGRPDAHPAGVPDAIASKPNSETTQRPPVVPQGGTSESEPPPRKPTQAMQSAAAIMRQRRGQA